MKLIKTTFNNFRCFSNYTVSYGTETTVFIGKNGTGKSSLLSGVRRGLSFMFAKPKTLPKNLSSSNNAKVQSFGKLEANFDPISRSFNYPINNEFNILFDGKEIEWSMVKNNMNGGLLTTQYNNALYEILNFYNQDLKASLPVLSVITDSFPHQMINFGAKAKKIISQEILPRDLSYYGWDERTNCTELWLSRFYKISNFEKDLNDDINNIEEQIFLYEKLIDNKDEHDSHKVPEWEEKIEELNKNLHYLKSDRRRTNFFKERDFVQKKLIEFTKPLSREYNFINDEFELFRVSVNRPDKQNFMLEFSFKDGRVISFDTLPMGYKRIFSIVLDIAYRSYILNGEIESAGVVLIDEIELHLHPTLQQEVLQRLRKTFPNIQFLVTTHSPLVVSNFKANKNNKLIKLEHDGNHYYNEEIESVYGLDYATNLSEIMEVDPRSSTIDKYLNAYSFLINKAKEKEANEMLMKLQEYLGGQIPIHIQNEIEDKKRKRNQQ